ncbi:hypothetical protein SO3561_08142 [Streptomyces olivochromogenes]|uniref:Uncharacterized protein n=1 Tax=Streptomyces olivochromogenes TaxID=1963 RepID=A0A250VR68_STROL|nr:hypothetical protein [Streptomyces olivochromogenes]GAX56574.1 hypothetical protein SO3561_08142 [Streptomyces olivochromogenes]
MSPQDVPDNLPVPAPQTSVQVQAARADLEAFEDLMFQVLETWGLPTDNIIVAAKQRETLLKNTPDVIEELTPKERASAPYIAKMIMAGSVGLFDAALNYLWNETVNRLRDHVAAFDVDYFFDLAEADPARRKNLKTRDDLAQFDDYKLLEAANKIKLISDIGFKQLTHVNSRKSSSWARAACWRTGSALCRSVSRVRFHRNPSRWSNLVSQAAETRTPRSAASQSHNAAAVQVGPCRADSSNRVASASRSSRVTADGRPGRGASVSASKPRAAKRWTAPRAVTSLHSSRSATSGTVRPRPIGRMHSRRSLVPGVRSCARRRSRTSRS